MMQNDMVNCGNPYEEGDAVLDASTIASYKPITGELRRYLHDVNENVDEKWLSVNIRWDRVNELCDTIDAIHAQLESDYKTACKVNERQDGSHIELLRQNESLRKKLANVREQLTNVQKALEDRNKGVLKQRWRKKCDQLNDRIADLEFANQRLNDQLASKDDEHAFAPESHYMLLPKDRYGKPVHLGDVMEWDDGKTAHVVGVGAGTFFYVDGINDYADWARTSDKCHHVDDSFERVILDAASRDVGTMSRVECNEFVKGLVARCKRLAGQS